MADEVREAGALPPVERLGAELRRGHALPRGRAAQPVAPHERREDGLVVAMLHKVVVVGQRAGIIGEEAGLGEGQFGPLFDDSAAARAQHDQQPARLHLLATEKGV